MLGIYYYFSSGMLLVLAVLFYKIMLMNRVYIINKSSDLLELLFSDDDYKKEKLYRDLKNKNCDPTFVKKLEKLDREIHADALYLGVFFLGFLVLPIFLIWVIFEALAKIVAILFFYFTSFILGKKNKQ
jgi:hypothetical protein